jgi:formylglycine-generating enzyme required for sulfatase activity
MHAKLGLSYTSVSKCSVLFLCFVAGFFVPAFAYEDMISVTQGAFYMGDDNELTDEKPRHALFVSAYFMDRTEITLKRWQTVRDWALSRGYEFSENQNFPMKGPSWFTSRDQDDYPMNNINWFDCLKWCNARSEFMGRKPVYYTDGSLIDVFRSGEIHFSTSQINTSASGYRLPTEAEWEKAARGGVTNIAHDYPWGYGLSGDFANYKLSGDPFDDGIAPVAYYNGFQEIISAFNSNGGELRQSSDRQNKLGFYDMIGNVSEWCWDWYDSAWYSNPLSKLSNSMGPDFSEEESGIIYGTSATLPDSTWEKKVHRGGGYKSDPNDVGDVLRVAYRGVEFPHRNAKTIGLRTVRGKFDDELWFDRKSYNFNRWYQLDWYGLFYQSPHTWVFHLDHGWLYPAGDGSYNNWIFYHFKGGWLWTSRYAYPWHYDPQTSKWFKDLSMNGESGWFESFPEKVKHQWGYGN